MSRRHALLTFLLLTVAGATMSCDSRRETMQPVLKRRADSLEVPGRHVDFTRYLRTGTVDGVPLRVVPIGELEAPIGVLLVSDPFYLSEESTRPLVRRVRPGRYPVSLVIADLGTTWGERVAFAVLKISDHPTAAWEIGRTVDHPQAEDGLFIVDTGLGAFADASAAALFGRTVAKFQGNYYDRVLAREFAPHEDWCDHRPDPKSSLNIIMFHSGLGDGVYQSYWGLDAGGEPTMLVADLQIFDSHGAVTGTPALTSTADKPPPSGTAPAPR